jgi:endonuclease III
MVPPGVDMRNSKEYSRKIQNLYHTLSHKHGKVQKVSHEEIIDAIVHGIVSAHLTEKEAQSAIGKFAEFFVDWNDLRVSRTEEIVEALGGDTPATRTIASAITKVLGGIFNDYHKLSLEALRKMGKRPARQALEKIDGVSRFVVDYCMLTSLRGHAIPLTGAMMDYLKSNELADPGADQEQIEGFLAKQVPARNGYEFYCLLRRESETGAGRKGRTRALKKAKK